MPLAQTSAFIRNTNIDPNRGGFAGCGMIPSDATLTAGATASFTFPASEENQTSDGRLRQCIYQLQRYFGNRYERVQVKFSGANV